MCVICKLVNYVRRYGGVQNVEIFPERQFNWFPCRSEISLWQLIGTPCYITFDFISILTALDRDGTSLTPTLSPPVWPVSDEGWTGGSVVTLDVNNVTYAPSDYPGAVTLSHENPATNLAIDRGPMVPANGRIGAKIRLKPHSCLSSQGDVSNGR